MVQILTMSETPNNEENQASPDSLEKKFKLGVPRLKKASGKLPDYGKNKLPGWQGRNGLWTWVFFGVALILLIWTYSRQDFSSKEIAYSEFKEKIRSGEIKKVIYPPTSTKGLLKRFPTTQTWRTCHFFTSRPVSMIPISSSSWTKSTSNTKLKMS